MRTLLAITVLALATPALADVPLGADRADVSAESVKLHGSSAPRARVRLFLDPACQGEAVAAARAGEDGRFTVDIPGAPPTPFTVSMVAEVRGRTSTCLTRHLASPKSRRMNQGSETGWLVVGGR
jgi:hypothetical protein